MSFKDSLKKFFGDDDSIENLVLPDELKRSLKNIDGTLVLESQKRLASVVNYDDSKTKKSNPFKISNKKELSHKNVSSSKVKTLSKDEDDERSIN